MDISKLQLFQLGIFKQIKLLFSSPGRTQKVINISETGLISTEVLALETGFMKAVNHRMSWAVVHNLMVEYCPDDTLEGDSEPVLLISEREYMPLDPFKRLSAEDLNAMGSLGDIAKNRHGETLAGLAQGDTYSARANMIQTIIYGGFLLTGLIVILKLSSCGGVD